MKGLFKKSLSLIVVAAIAVSTFSTVALAADEETKDYTTHVWETFEDGQDAASKSGKTSFTSLDTGKYGKGAKYTYSTYDGSDRYAQFDFALSDKITLAEAINNNLTVEVEFDFYGASLTTDDNYFYLASARKSSSNFAAGFSMKNNGQTKALNYLKEGKPVDIKRKYDTFGNYHTFKVVLHAEKEGYYDPVKKTETTADSWVLDGFYFDGEEQKSQAKYTLGGCTGKNDFTHLYFRFKSDSTLAGEIGLDNVSVTSYPTPSNGVSHVPDRHAFMDKVLTYKETANAGAYSAALATFEQDYLTNADITKAYYLLEGNSALYTISNIGKDAGTVTIQGNDTVGGTPILVLAAFDSQHKLSGLCVKKITAWKDGSSKTVDFSGNLTVPEKGQVGAFIFESFDTLFPLAATYRE